MSNMTRILLFGNDLAGNVPSEFGQMSNLEVLQLHNNPQITGLMPEEVCALSETGDLDLLMVQCAGFGPDGQGVECPDGCCECGRG